MEGLLYYEATTAFLQAFEVNEEGIYKLTVDCAHLFPRKDRCRKVAIYWNKFGN